MGSKWDIEKFTGDNDFGLEGKDETNVNTTKVWESFEGWKCVNGHHVTSGEDRDGGQGQKCHCLVPRG